jgi:hypothetical protein
MKRTVPRAGLTALATGLSLIGLAAVAGTSQPLPTPFPRMRYQQMSARSPFAIASAAAAATPAATPGFAAQLYVDGVAHAGQSDYVAIKSRDPQKPVTLFLEVGKSTDDGLKVERVKWSEQMGKSTVEVSKGGDKATLAFDEAQLTTVPNQPAPAPVPQPPGQVGFPPPVPPRRVPGRPNTIFQNGQYRQVRMFPPQMPVEPGQ